MEKFDVIIIGGGAVGLSAALVLGRSRKRTLVCNLGEPRNAPSHESHSLFSRDGASPAELLRIGHEQLAPYESVETKQERVVHAFKSKDHFEVELQNGTHLIARSLIIN
ncbi:MAG: FAD-binding protein [Heteroscytonema crispum UTEX LB 1556]